MAANVSCGLYRRHAVIGDHAYAPGCTDGDCHRSGHCGHGGVSSAWSQRAGSRRQFAEHKDLVLDVFVDPCCAIARDRRRTVLAPGCDVREGVDPAVAAGLAKTNTRPLPNGSTVTLDGGSAKVAGKLDAVTASINVPGKGKTHWTLLLMLENAAGLRTAADSDDPPFPGCFPVGANRARGCDGPAWRRAARAASSRIELSASSTVPSVQTPQSTTYCEAQLAILQPGDVLELGRAAGQPAYSRAFLTVELGAIHVGAKVRLISVSGVVVAERGGLEVEQIRSLCLVSLRISPLEPPRAN